MNARRLLMSAGALLAACPAAPPPDPLPAPPQIVAFTASPSAVTRGGTVTLKWKTENAPTVEVIDLTRGAIGGAADKPEGEVQVPVSQSTVFVISAKNARGARASSVASVQVDGVQASGLLFAAYPTVLPQGRPGLLVWNAPGAKQLQISPTGAAALDLKGQLASGSIEVNPTAAETTYTLTADGVRRTVVVVRGQGIREFTSSKSLVKAGAPLSLSWKTENATKVTLSSPTRGTLREVTGADATMGSFADTVAEQAEGSSLNYVLAAEGKGPTESKVITVYYGSEVNVVAASAPPYVKENTRFPITFTTAGADRVEIQDGPQILHRSPDRADVSQGSVELPAPSMQTDYKVVAFSSRSGQKAEKSVRVTPVRDVGTATLTANPSTVATGGTPVTLTWNVPNAVRTRIVENQLMTVVSVEGPMAAMGSATVYPNKGATRYELQSSNTIEAPVSAQASVTVTTPATASSADGGTIYQSQTSAQLRWNVGGATSELVGFGTPTAAIVSNSTAFIDISTTGTKLAFPRGANEAIVSFSPIGFETFLGNRRVEGDVWVSTNGFLQFSRSPVISSRPTPAPIPAVATAPVPENLIAPLWADLELGQAGDVYWAQTGSAPHQELIVQWSNVQVRGQPASQLSFQARIHQAGALTFEYQTIQTTAPVAVSIGYQGPVGLGYSHGFAGPVVDGGVNQFPPPMTRLTFAYSQRSPAIVSTLAAPGAGVVKVGMGALRLEYDEIVKPTDILVTEVMNVPNPAVPNGQWLEIGNFSNATIDLSGWSLTQLDGGFSATLPAASLAPRAFQVLAQSADPMLNDGLPASTVALPSISLRSAGGLLRLTNPQGFVSTLPYPAATSGVSINLDRGPFALRNAAQTDPWTSGLCTARLSQTFGNLSPSQRGTPGASGEGACIGYSMRTITPKFNNIAASGTVVNFVATSAFEPGDEGMAQINLSAAPILLYGRTITALAVSSNGFVFPNQAGGGLPLANAGVINKYSPDSFAPDPGAIIAPFWDDLRTLSGRAGSAVLYQRIAANQDPNEPRPHWIVQFNRVEHYLGGDDITFQVKLFDSGDVEFHYATLISGNSSQYAAGSSATVWLEQDGPASARALMYSFETPTLSTATALQFTRVP